MARSLAASYATCTVSRNAVSGRRNAVVTCCFSSTATAPRMLRSADTHSAIISTKTKNGVCDGKQGSVAVELEVRFRTQAAYLRVRGCAHIGSSAHRTHAHLRVGTNAIPTRTARESRGPRSDANRVYRRVCRRHRGHQDVAADAWARRRVDRGGIRVHRPVHVDGGVRLRRVYNPRLGRVYHQLRAVAA